MGRGCRATPGGSERLRGHQGPLARYEFEPYNDMEIDVPKLKELREEAVLSQRELARMANLAYGTVWRIENGFPEVHPSTIRKLARVLGVESKELVKRGG